MFDLFKKWYEVRRLRAQNAITAETIRKTKLSRVQADWQSEDPIESVAFRQLAERMNDKTARDNWYPRAYYLYHNNPVFGNAIRLVEKYVIGTGFQIHLDNPKHETIISDFQNAVNWKIKRFEIVRRLFRDGEIFIYCNSDFLKFIDPIHVATPTNKLDDQNVQEGIQFEDEIPIGFFVNGNYIPAESNNAKIFHWKMCVDENEPRGISPFLSLAPIAQSIVEFATFRLRVNENAGLWAMHEKASYHDGNGHSWSQLQPGQIITTDNETDLQILSADTQATNAAEDARFLGLLSSLSQGLPEYLCTADASNGSYSSTMVAEGPGVKTLEYYQELVGTFIEELFTYVISLSSSTAPNITFTFPSAVTTDISQEASAAVIYRSLGASKDTLLSMLGFDPKEESDKIAQEVTDEAQTSTSS